jgi:hypothetical protein
MAGSSNHIDRVAVAAPTSLGSLLNVRDLVCLDVGQHGKQIMTHCLLLKRFQLPDEGWRDATPHGERPNGADHRLS